MHFSDRDEIQGVIFSDKLGFHSVSEMSIRINLLKYLV